MPRSACIKPQRSKRFAGAGLVVRSGGALKHTVLLVCLLSVPSFGEWSGDSALSWNDNFLYAAGGAELRRTSDGNWFSFRWQKGAKAK